MYISTKVCDYFCTSFPFSSQIDLEPCLALLQQSCGKVSTYVHTFKNFLISLHVCTYVHMDKFVKRWAKVTNGRLGSDKG